MSINKPVQEVKNDINVWTLYRHIVSSCGGGGVPTTNWPSSSHLIKRRMCRHSMNEHLLFPASQWNDKEG